jgi:type II secretory pathway pseudopilin PulG
MPEPYRTTGDTTAVPRREQGASAIRAASLYFQQPPGDPIVATRSLHNARESGFTLIEAVIAALILLVAIVFVAQMFVTAIRQNRSSRQYTHATAVAQSKLEELNAVPIGQLQYGGDLATEGGDGRGATGYVDYVAVDNLETDRIGVVERPENANYVRYWRIDPDPDPRGWSGVYRISVRVVSLRAAAGEQAEEATVATVRSVY